MPATTSLLLDNPNTNEFLADDWATTELPVPVTDQATATAEPPATATPLEDCISNHEHVSEAFLYINEYPEYDPHDSEQYYVRTRNHAPQLQRFTPRD